MAKTQARGLRNFNPGNLDYNPKNKWQGQLGIETDVPPGIAPRFAKFKSMEYGIRALATLCITYYDKYDCDTLQKFFMRYAPPIENDTTSYAKAVARDVAKAMGTTVTITTPINLHIFEVLRAIVCGIIEHENGIADYKLAVTDAQVDKGMTLAGVEPPKKPLAQTKTMKNATVLGTTGLAAATTGAFSFIEDHSVAIPIIRDIADLVQGHYIGLFMTFGVVVIACAAYMAYNRWMDRLNGVR